VTEEAVLTCMLVEELNKSQNISEESVLEWNNWSQHNMLYSPRNAMSVSVMFWASRAIQYLSSSFYACSIFSTSPRNHEVVLERDRTYGSYSKDQACRDPNGSASASELFRQVGYWTGGGSRGEVACDTGTFFHTHTHTHTHTRTHTRTRAPLRSCSLRSTWWVSVYRIKKI
jgi:hypothetical protein